MNEVVETIYQWHKGMKIRHISLSLGLDRKTVRKYLGLARSSGVTREKRLPDEQELIMRLKDVREHLSYVRPAFDLLYAHRGQIETWLADANMTGKQVWRLLKEVHGIEVGYTTIKRYLRKKRRTWAFIMTLSYSRHKFVRFVFRQDIDAWLDCHERAFAFFGGVPQRIILDNLKSGVIKPDIYDPTLNRAYADMERHCGFVADPARVRAPEHKGKVERVVPVVRKHLLAGRIFCDVHEANQRALHWCKEEIGKEVHGTTKKKPYEAFISEERAHLKPLPDVPFERPLWKQCTVHPDHHIVFDKSYYSLPTRYIGNKVWVKGTKKIAEIFLDHERIKVHPRSHTPGRWITDQTDYPPEKLAFLMVTPTWCRKKAAEFGPFTEALVAAILKENVMRNLRKVQAILRLGEKFPGELEKVAKRALSFGNTRYRSIKAMLEQGISEAHQGPSAPAPLSEMGQRFLRPPAYFAREAAL